VQGINITSGNAPGSTTIGGIVPVKSVKQLDAEAKAAASAANNTTVVQNLATYIRGKWMQARTAKQTWVEERMYKSVRARRGEYEPSLLAQIAEQGGTQIYMYLTSNKCRAASSWLRDVLLGANNDKPWTVSPNPVPDMQPSVLADLMARAEQQIAQVLAQGANPTQEEIKQLLMSMKDESERHLRTIAEHTIERMEKKMESQMLDGGWARAFTQFIDDLTTFPSAILKGPVVRKRQVLKWVKDPQDPANYVLDTSEALKLEWERVDPFMAYPAPDATDVDDGAFIERHQLSRSDLLAMIGVDGYSEKAIRAVLEDYGRGGLREWIFADAAKLSAEGKTTIGANTNPSELIDALQFWGSVQGSLLRDWGLSEEEVPDPLQEYAIEAWLIGTWVIKAVVNPDPLGRKPYYKASWEEIPGVFWGNSVADLCRDTQNVCNAAARALVNNMSLASGPQVVFNIDRLPQGENITQLFPWKIWQVTSDPMNGGQRPIDFYQPNSMAQELMAIYERFSTLADEYTGIPRYMMGGQAPGGAGRTASGMSMMMNNAGKNIKQVIANIDERVLSPAVGRLYYMNMRYGDDPELKGDINVVARGVSGLLAKEAAQQRRNEFLQIALGSPVAQQIIGPEGVAYLLRQMASTLEMNPDDLVPTDDVVKARILQAQQMAMQQQMMAQGGGAPGGMPQGPQAQIAGQMQPGGAPQGPSPMLPGGEQVTNLMPSNGQAM
jgi:phosphohistidine phosphatase SixA